MRANVSEASSGTQAWAIPAAQIPEPTKSSALSLYPSRALTSIAILATKNLIGSLERELN